jgi:hypothetical protein
MQLPGDHVVGAAGIAADAEAAYDVAAMLVKRQAAAEDDNSANRLSDKRIIVFAVLSLAQFGACRTGFCELLPGLRGLAGPVPRRCSGRNW